MIWDVYEAKYFMKVKTYRIVSHIEWFDDQQRVRFVDYYSKNGIKFAQTVYDLNRKAILKKYMTARVKK